MSLAARPLIVAIILGLLAGCSDSPEEKLIKEFYGYKTKANKGDPVAQYNLGVCYANGYGVANDKVEAV